jgi:putative transposase
MPCKYAVKSYKKDSYYHIFNRGVEKRNVFLCNNDYNKFLKSLKESSAKSKTDILCYCLMPNHFHLLVFQKDERGIEKLMRSLATKYVMYFNIKYGRVGSLFQGSYKARCIINEQDLLYVSAYIHNNPRKDKPGLLLKNYKYSSYNEYVLNNEKSFIKTEPIKMHFLVEEYRNYVEKQLNSEGEDPGETLS